GFNEYAALQRNLKKANKVEDVISIPSAVNLVKDSATERLKAQNIFGDTTLSQAQIDSGKNVFFNLPFYRGLLYNLQDSAWLMGVRINREVMNSKKRNVVVANVVSIVDDFSKKTHLEVYLSGLPLVRTIMTTRIANEMRWFLLISVILSAVILLLFFRSLSAMLLSLTVVIIGVVWSLGIMHLFDYKITLLTA